MPEKRVHTKGTMRKGMEPRLGSLSEGQTGSGGAQGMAVLRWGRTGTLATLPWPGPVPAQR